MHHTKEVHTLSKATTTCSSSSNSSSTVTDSSMTPTLVCPLVEIGVVSLERGSGLDGTLNNSTNNSSSTITINIVTILKPVMMGQATLETA